jgi:hypothetical protein
MFKKIKAAGTAILMATLYPVLRLGGQEGGEGQVKGQPAAPHTPAPATEPTPAADPPARTPEARIKDLEKELAARNNRIMELETRITETSRKAGTTGEHLKKAIDAYKTLLINSNPEIVPELISGDNLEDLDNSLTRARELTGKIKNNLATHSQHTRIPAGAPERGAEDISGLSAREKISRGIERE